MIYISNEIIRDENITDDAVVVYVFLQILTYSPNYDSVTFNVSQIVDQAYGEVNSHSVCDKVKAGLKSIVDNGYLDIIKESSHWWRIFMTSYKVADEGYVAISADAARTIMDDEHIRNKPSILRYYLLLLTTIYTKTKVGTYDQSWFCEKLGVSKQTLSKYTRFLEEKQLIAVYRSALNNVSNTYGRFDDKALVDIEGGKRSQGREAHENANIKRKYVAMYRSFIDGKEYPVDTLKEILKAMQARNYELQDLGANARGEVYDLQPLIDKINREC